MRLIISVGLILFVLTTIKDVMAITMPVEGLPYSKFPSDEEEKPSITDPRSWYSTVYCGKYLGYWQSRGEGSGSHPGVDIRLNAGTPIRAIAQGKVVKVKSMWRWGKLVVIEHRNMPGVPRGEPLYSIYAHLSKIAVMKGDKVQEGSVIGLSGDSEIINIPHLHFQIDRYVKGARHPFFPSREGQCTGCEWVDPDHVVNHPDSDSQVKRHTLNPIEYILRYKNYVQVQPGDKLATLEEGVLCKGSGPEIYLHLNGTLHPIPDSSTLAILEGEETAKVMEVPDRLLFMMPHVHDIPPLRDGLVVTGLGAEVYTIREKRLIPGFVTSNTSEQGTTVVIPIPDWLLARLLSGEKLSSTGIKTGEMNGE